LLLEHLFVQTKHRELAECTVQRGEVVGISEG